MTFKPAGFKHVQAVQDEVWRSQTGRSETFLCMTLRCKYVLLVRHLPKRGPSQSGKHTCKCTSEDQQATNATGTHAADKVIATF